MTDGQAFVNEYTNQSLSEMHHALRASRRRLVVALVAHRYFAPDYQATKRDRTQEWENESEPEVSVRQLAKEIAAIEQDTSPDNATGDDYRNVYTALVQTHLPELYDIGAIKYNDDRKTVRPERNLAALAMVAAVTSPITQMLFHNAVARASPGLSADGSTGD
jgi:hypothetical protein